MRESVKQRIIGVLVLVALAAVFVPVLFDLEPRQRIDTGTEIPPSPDIEPVTIPEPEQVAGIEAPKPAEQAFLPPEPEQDAEAAPGADEAGESEPEPESEPAAPAPAPSPAEVPESGLGDDDLLDAWVVQVGSFAEAASAEELVARLKKDGYKAYNRSAVSAGKPVNRVFVGPVVSKAQAEEYKRAIDSKLGVSALVLEFAP